MIHTVTSSVPRRKCGRRGSALILTMIMLVLIVVLFSSFMIMAIYNHKNAKEGEALIQARLHCQTGLHVFYRDLAVQWAQPTMENLYPSSKSSQTNFFSPTSGDWAGRFYWASIDTDNTGIAEAMHTPLAGIDFVPSSLLNSSIGWQAVYDPQGSGEVVARLCYLVIDESGKVDPSVVVDTAFAEGAEPFTGTSTKDISLLPLFSSATFAQRFRPNSVVGGTMPDTAFWFSYFHILKTHPTALTGSNYQDVIRGTVFPFSLDIDAFSQYEEVEGNTVPVTRHRLDITAVNWDAMNNSLDSCVIDSESALFWEGSLPSTPATDVNGDLDYGIPYIHHALDEEIKNHVLANLVDYCDKDNLPTSDYDFTKPDIAPTYVGLEKVPYLNEVGFTAEIRWIGDMTTGSYHLVITTYPELINCYKDDYGGGCEIQMQIEVSADTAILGTELDPRELTFTVSDIVPKRGYYAFPPTVDALGVSTPHPQIDANVKRIPLNDPGIWDDAAVGSVTYLEGISITINSAKIVRGASPNLDLLDYAFDEPSPTRFALNTPPGRVYAMTTEVDDPRHNLSPKEWTWGPAWIMGIVGTLGTTNTRVACNPSGPAHDPEAFALTGPTDLPPDTPFPVALDLTSKPFRGVSTMYIRNGPMESLWEFGCIHRGEKWRTLNLAAFNAAATATEGMNDYASGDANILDQVKIGDQTQTLGRINVNTPYKEVIQSLLSRVTIGGTYEDSALTNRRITAAVAGDIARSGTSPVINEWLFHNGSTGGKSSVTDVGGDPFINRGQISQVPNLSNGMAYTPGDLTDFFRQDVDMWREEIIGKVVGLTTTRPNFFTVIIVAQTVKDMPSKGGTLGVFDPGIDEVLAEQKTMAILHRDGFDNRFTVLRLEYLE